MKKMFFLLLILTGCAPSSLEDFEREGEGVVRAMTATLEQIHTREQLRLALPQLEKQFEALVDLMIEARLYQQNHPEDESLYESFTSDILRSELLRVYTIEGGREAIEAAQHEALLRLDAFERSLARKSELRRK